MPSSNRFGRDARAVCLLVLAFCLSPSTTRAQTLNRPIVTIAATDSVASEPTTQIGMINLGSGTAALSSGHFTITRSGSAASSLTVNLAVSGSATAGADYTAIPSTIVIPAGAQSATITVSPVNDQKPERDEDVIVAIASSLAYTSVTGSAAARITIIDNDQTLRLTAIDPQAPEPGDFTFGQVTIERLGTLRGKLDFTVVLGGSATLDIDYRGVPGAYSFPEGVALLTLQFVAKPDNIAEGTEFVNVKVTGVPMEQTGGVNISIPDASVSVKATFPTVIEGPGNSATFTFTRTGDLNKPATMEFLVSGTATRGVDYDIVSTSLSFIAGQATNTRAVTMRADTLEEGSETIIVTLQPTDRLATGTPNSATLLITDNVPPVVAAVTIAPNHVRGGTSATGTVTLNGPAPAAGLPITLISNGTAVVLATTQLTIPPGATSANFPIPTVPVPTISGAPIGAKAPTGAQVNGSFSVDPPVITTLSTNQQTRTPQSTPDSSIVVTLSLDGPSPGSTMPITISANPSVVTVPSSITVPAGATSATFRVVAVPLASDANVTVTATRGQVSLSANLVILAPKLNAVTFNPTQAVGRNNGSNVSQGTFTLNGPVPTSGMTLQIAPSSSLVTVNTSSLFLPGGVNSGTFEARPKPVDATTAVPVQLTLGSHTLSGSLTIVPPTPTSIALSSSTTIGGTNNGPGQVAATVTLNGDAGPAGLNVPVASSSQVASACNGSPLAFPANSLSLQFAVCTQQVSTQTSTNITAGTSPSVVSAPLTVTTPAAANVSSIVLSDLDVTGGVQTVQISATISLASAAPGPTNYTVTASNPAVKFRLPNTGAGPFNSIQVPVATGQTAASVLIVTTAVPVDTGIVITASPGNRTVVLMVRAAVITEVGVVPTGSGSQALLDTLTITPGASRNMVVRLSGPSPAAGYQVQLTSSSPFVTVPTVVTVTSGAQPFAATAGAPTSDVVATITARLGSSQDVATVRVPGAASVSSLSVSPTQVAAGTGATGTITINAPAPASGMTVPLTNANSHTTVPSNVVIAQGQTSATFPITTAVFGAQGTETATITATGGGQSRSATLTLDPFRILTFTASPSSVTGGQSVQLTVQLNRAAPPSGLVVTLSSPNPVLSVPLSITVPGNQSSVTVNATTQTVTAAIGIPVTATLEAATASVTVTVQPPPLH